MLSDKTHRDDNARKRMAHKHGVLIVEDAPDIRYLVASVLESEGFEVYKATNGKEALDMLRSGEVSPAVILLDLKMPIMNGLEFRHRQVEIPELSEIPVVLMSADNQNRAETQAARIDEFIRKPLDLDELVDVAEKYCRPA